MADVLNTVLELGGVTYLERIENSMRFRNLANVWLLYFFFYNKKFEDKKYKT